VPRSAALYQEGLIHYATRREPHGIAEALAGLAGLAAIDGQTELAARLRGAVETMRDAVGFRLQGPFAASGHVDPPEGRAGYERSIAPIRVELGDARYEAELAAGQAMPLAQAVAEAAAFVPTPPRSRPNRPRSAR
jgi:hypothetical protein